jgi:hypothetical protein
VRVQIVRDPDGQVLSAVQMERTAFNEVLVEPVLEEGQQAEVVEVSRSELLDLERLFTSLCKKGQS